MQNLEGTVSKNTCGQCNIEWPACPCDQSQRTESVATLLSNAGMFPDLTRRHLCVFVYHGYERWTESSEIEDFSVACVPAWEGWYAAWVKPGNTRPQEVPWAEEPVVQCTVQYQDGSSLEGYLERSGALSLNVPAPAPPGGHDYDADRRMLRTRVAVTQGLSLAEIQSGTRGRVHGTRGVPNNARRVSHVLGEDKRGEMTSLALLPERPGEAAGAVTVGTGRVARVAPFLLEERKWRMRRRFTKSIGRIVQLFLKALFERARCGDEAAWYACERRWRQAAPSSAQVLSSVAWELPRLLEAVGGKDAGKERGKERGKGVRAGADVEEGRPRAERRA